MTQSNEEIKTEGIKTILKALDQVWHEVSHAPKDRTNDHFHYDYTSEQGVLKVLRPAMLKAGLLLIPSGKDVSPIDENGNTFVTVDYTLAHKDGHIWPEKITGFGCGNDRAGNGKVGDKGLYKALTGANKYLLFKLFQIATGDDPENNSDSDEDATTTTVPTTTSNPEGNGNHVDQYTNTCPKCSKMAIIASKYDQGGFYCFPAKGGCGAKFENGAALRSDQKDIPIGEPPANDKTVSEAQIKLLHVRREKAGWTEQELKDLLQGSFAIDSAKEIPAEKFSEVLEYVNND